MKPDCATHGGLAEESMARRERSALRRFTLLEGGAMVLLGAVALSFPVIVSYWLTGVIAVVFVVAGGVRWISTLGRVRHLSRTHAFSSFVVATLLVLSGIWMVSRLAHGPAAAGAAVMALALAAGVVFLLEGILASLFSLGHRHSPGWGWGLLNGVITLAIGGGLLSLNASAWPRMLGVLVGISFVLSGLDLLGFRLHIQPPHLHIQPPQRTGDSDKTGNL
jgi:uncharacterized membrane protein HdeD (DUF308 family)